MAEAINHQLARRIVHESVIVAADFPGRFQLSLLPNGRTAWLGSVPIEAAEFPVRLIYPPAYPAVPPVLATSLPLPSGCPHTLGRDGEWSMLCWLAPETGRMRGRWDPTRHTAATALRAAQRWGLAYRVWQVTQIWPVPDAWEIR